MEKYEIVISPEMTGSRLDKIIATTLGELSRGRIQRLISEGKVEKLSDESTDAPVDRENAIIRDKNYRVSHGEIFLVTVDEPVPESGILLPEPMPEDLKIEYEDGDIIILDKPRGLTVHPGAGEKSGTLLNALLGYIGDDILSVGDPERPGIVHRIDKDTSGLLVVAKTEAAYGSLRKQFDEHSIDRKYIGLAHNNIKEDEFTVDKNLVRDPINRVKYRVTDDGGRRAVTHIRVIERYGKYTLFEASLETGRTHQIRVHMASMGYPLVGDRTYGPRKDKLNMDGQVLHAAELGFIHPRTGENVNFSSPLPEYFCRALKKIGAELPFEKLPTHYLDSSEIFL